MTRENSKAREFGKNSPTTEKILLTVSMHVHTLTNELVNLKFTSIIVTYHENAIL